MSEPTPETPETQEAKPAPRRPVVENSEPNFAGALVILWLLLAGAWKTVEVIAVTIQILGRAFF